MSNLNNRALALVVSKTISYCGGYIYSGANITGTVPYLRQEVRDGSGPDFTPNQGDVAYNKARLARAPVGSEVGIYTGAQNLQMQETWEKVGPCSWAKVEDWDKRWGDWGRASINNLTGQEEVEMYD